MKNKLQDLNNHLFAQLERLDNEELTAEGLDTEIQRSKAITAISNQIINNAKLALDATKLQVEYGTAARTGVAMPEMLENKTSNAKGQG